MLSNKLPARQILVMLLGSVARQIQADVHDHNPRIVVPYTTTIKFERLANVW